jgi:hypothetical protein
MEQTISAGSTVARSVALRPLALPSEHGGWGILLEPIAIGLLVAGSWSGVLVGAAAVCNARRYRLRDDVMLVDSVE